MTENHTKILVFTALDTLQLKKLMIVKMFTVWTLCICLLITQVDILSTASLKKKNENKYLIFDTTDENKELLKKISSCLEWN